MKRIISEETQKTMLYAGRVFEAYLRRLFNDIDNCTIADSSPVIIGRDLQWVHGTMRIVTLFNDEKQISDILTSVKYDREDDTISVRGSVYETDKDTDLWSEGFCYFSTCNTFLTEDVRTEKFDRMIQSFASSVVMTIIAHEKNLDLSVVQKFVTMSDPEKA